MWSPSPGGGGKRYVTSILSPVDVYVDDKLVANLIGRQAGPGILRRSAQSTFRKRQPGFRACHPTRRAELGNLRVRTGVTYPRLADRHHHQIAEAPGIVLLVRQPSPCFFCAEILVDGKVEGRARRSTRTSTPDSIALNRARRAINRLA